jgi:uncharacterized protein (TIGR01619 family)
MSDSDWDFYQCNVNSKPASIYVDLGLRSVAPDLNRNIILCIWVYFKHPNPENGLSTQQEFETLSSIEDALSEALVSNFSASYAGRITNDGRREFYFYSSSSTALEAKVQAALLKFGEYKYEAWAQPDAEWNQYLNLLYPSKSNLRWMMDRRVTETLERQGDQLTSPRPIEHYSYFSTEKDRSEFIKIIKANGFEIIRKSEPTTDDARHGVIYKKSQPATLNEVYRTTGFLEEQSEHFKGDYDGWESIVVKQQEKAKRWWQLSK